MKEIINIYPIIIVFALLSSCSSYSRNNMNDAHVNKGVTFTRSSIMLLLPEVPTIHNHGKQKSMVKIQYLFMLIRAESFRLLIQHPGNYIYHLGHL